MDGSMLPRLILPLLFMACYSTAITSIHLKVHPLTVSTNILTYCARFRGRFSALSRLFL